MPGVAPPSFLLLLITANPVTANPARSGSVGVIANVAVIAKPGGRADFVRCAREGAAAEDAQVAKRGLMGCDWINCCWA
jgi:hypothetical protein